MLMTRKRKTVWGRRLVALRERLGMNIPQAARRIGVSKATWSSWEVGRRTPRGAYLTLIELLETGQLPTIPEKP